MQEKLQNISPELWGGIECTINRVENNYFDQLHYAGHYNRPGDAEQLISTGVKKIRYPILWEKHEPVQNIDIDWSWTESQLTIFRQYRVEVIAGLLHHGSGPAFTDLLDPHFPELLAGYAEKVIQKFPWLNYFTPVNEPLTTARFSGLYGFWYPHQKNDGLFLRMLLNQVKGIVLSMQAIRKVNPQAKLVQTEDLGKTYSTPLLQYQADWENHRRWLSYDLLCGKVNPSHALWSYFIDNGITANELQFFVDNVCVPDIIGCNHYLTSERFLDENVHLYPKHTHGGNGQHAYADVEAVRVSLTEETGIAVLLQEVWERYKKPLAITEVHLHCHREEQLRWFAQVWKASKKLCEEGAEIIGVTAWAMLGSFGWNKLLTAPKGEYEPGVFDVRNGTLRPTALATLLKNIAKVSATQHLANDKGWWQRVSRFYHQPSQLPTRILQVPENTSPLVIIGKNGTLGRAFAKVCEERSIPYQLISRHDCDISNAESIAALLTKHRPWAIINAAGYVRVDDAESEIDKCFYDNTRGAENLAAAAIRFGCKLLSFSSDLVFDGSKNSPYLESDASNPLNIYGHTKAQAEEIVLKVDPSALMIRTSAFFGPWDEYNFCHYIRNSLQQEEMVSVANDVIISPTYVPDLVNASLDLLIDNESGIWHLTNEGEISWADLANEVADRFNLNRKYIQPVPNSQLNYPAKRPHYSVLSSARGIMLPTLADALRRYTDEISRGIQKEKTRQMERA